MWEKLSADPNKKEKFALGFDWAGLRDILPQTIAQDIVGVQPMQGQAGEVFKIKHRYKGGRDEAGNLEEEDT